MEESLTEVQDNSSRENAGNNLSKSPQENANADTSDQKNTSTSSTAFTISFEDDNSGSKKLGIRDPIQKFAPPKPQTVEKPRPSKSRSCQDHSITSIESAPAGLSKHLFRDSKRSSERASNSSRQSNISESAAFLIDKMLYYRQTNEDPQTSREQGEMLSKRSPRGAGRSDHGALADSSRLPPDSSADHCDDKSDNGTYILGADPESDVARKKIDELFGVVKAAEASLIADSAARNSRRETQTRLTGRPSRPTDKKPLNHNHTYATTSRGSSACRQESSYSAAENYYPKTSSRNSRNSSCERTAKPLESRPQRSFSQSSRHSSNKKLSDADTRSSRSSLNNDAYISNQENSLPNLPSMKFNRAFALRRARLGLEPTPRVSTTQNYIHAVDPSSSPRRQMVVKSDSNRSGSAGFSREDGGRYSLRVKNSIPPGRLGAQNTAFANRYPQHNAIVDSLANRLSANRLGSSVLGSYETQTRSIISPRHTAHHSSTYQSSDEQLEPMSPSRYRLAQKSSRSQMRGQSDMDNEEHLNYSLGAEPADPSIYHLHEGPTDRRGSSLQLGALDSLVISAISSLSLKIRLSVCDLMVEHAKKLPVDNETRIVVEEIIPQLLAETSSSKSPTSIDEINQALYFDLAKTLKNLKKVEQMVDVMNMIANQLPTASSAMATSSLSTSGSASNNIVNLPQETGTARTNESTGTSASEPNSAQDLSSV